MALVHTIPETDATVPPSVRNAGNGQLPADWLRSFDGSTRTDYKLFAPVSYAMQALHIAAAADGVRFATTGRYRSLAQQTTLFRSRYTPGPFNAAKHRTSPSVVRRVWLGQEWYLLKGMAMAATPGTSNHGWAIADDVAEFDAAGKVISITNRGLQWLKDNAGSFGFALDIHEEPWHWHWVNGTALTQRTADVLTAAGVKVPSLAAFGFTVPGATPTTPPPPPPVVTPPVTKPPTGPLPTQGDHAMHLLAHEANSPTFWVSSDGGKTRFNVRSLEHVRALVSAGVVDPKSGVKFNGDTWINASVLTVTELDAYLGRAA